MYCSKCGNLINQGENFCNKCGNQILNNNYQNGFNNTNSYNNNYNVNYNKKETKKFRTGRNIGFLFLGVFAWYFVFMFIQVILTMNNPSPNYEAPAILSVLGITVPIWTIILGVPIISIMGLVKNSKK